MTTMPRGTLYSILKLVASAQIIAKSMANNDSQISTNISNVTQPNPAFLDQKLPIIDNKIFPDQLITNEYDIVRDYKEDLLKILSDKYSTSFIKRTIFPTIFLDLSIRKIDQSIFSAISSFFSANKMDNRLIEDILKDQTELFRNSKFIKSLGESQTIKGEFESFIFSEIFDEKQFKIYLKTTDKTMSKKEEKIWCAMSQAMHNCIGKYLDEEYFGGLFIGASEELLKIDNQQKAAVLKNNFGNYFIDMINDLIKKDIPENSVRIDEKSANNLSLIIVESNIKD